jgi:hypothetical protein
MGDFCKHGFFLHQNTALSLENAYCWIGNAILP